MNEKNQQLIWDLYVGITRDTQKTNGYYGNICRYCKECYKNLANTIDRYVGIARDATKTSGYNGTYMRVLHI